MFHFIILVLGTNCTPPAIDDFPGDLFTPEQRQAGAVIIHITISLYLFLALAVVCDRYFVPAVEKISQGIAIHSHFNSILFSRNFIEFSSLFYLFLEIVALNMSSDICGGKLKLTY